MLVDRQVRICYVISSLANSGPVNMLYGLVSSLDCERFRVSIVTLVEEKENSRAADFLALGVDVRLASEWNVGRGFWSWARNLRALVRGLVPEIIHTHCPRSLLATSLLLRRARHVYTAHVFPGVQQYALYGRLFGSVVTVASNFLMRRTSLAIACSKSVANEFRDRLGWKVPAVPNGCTFQVWNRCDVEKRTLRGALGLETAKTYFVYVGRFSEEKNPLFLADAFESCDARGVELIMLGDGPLLSEARLRKYSRVKSVGFTTDVVSYLRACDYYVSASRTEGLANTLLEGMAAGLPVLLSRIPSHEQVFADSSRQLGYLFDGDNADDFATGMQCLISADRNQLSENVQDEYREKYTAKRMASEYADKYISLVA